jgi:hypothetical protein
MVSLLGVKDNNGDLGSCLVLQQCDITILFSRSWDGAGS